MFYRKGLIALPITDNATINDLGEERRERARGMDAQREGAAGEVGRWERVPCRPPTSSVR